MKPTNEVIMERWVAEATTLQNSGSKAGKALKGRREERELQRFVCFLADLTTEGAQGRMRGSFPVKH